MSNVLLILFTMTLLYLSVAGRLATYTNIIAFQGVLLFGVAFIELLNISPLNLIFILLETIIFKSIVVPMFLNFVIKRNNIDRDSEPFIPNFVSLFIITLIIIGTFILSNYIDDTGIHKIFFVVAVSTLFSGLYIIVSRKKIITHVLGYLVVENGVFILSLAVGNEMPLLVNLGILLDIFASVFLLGIFVNKIGDEMKDMDVGLLRNLKD